jgi:hypothetical protein
MQCYVLRFRRLKNDLQAFIPQRRLRKGEPNLRHTEHRELFDDAATETARRKRTRSASRDRASPASINRFGRDDQTD